MGTIPELDIHGTVGANLAPGVSLGVDGVDLDSLDPLFGCAKTML